MKPTLKSFAPRIASAFLVALLGVMAVHGQTRDSHTISARAGGVNFVSGAVDVLRGGATQWQRLATTDDLQSGDAVKTGADGLVEVLLNPGSYLRLAGNSEFVLTDASLDELRLKLGKGSMVVEATSYGDDEAFIMIDTPHTGVSIIKSGVYRINALQNKMSEVAVYGGRALVVAGQATLVRGSQKARVVTSGGAVEVAKFDKKLERDAFDVWSKERAKSIAEASRKLTSRNVNALLASMRNDNLWSSAYSSRPRNGAWVYNTSRGCYTFVPFYGGGGSPYGYYYAYPLAWFGYEGLCRNCNGAARGFGQSATGRGTATSTEGRSNAIVRQNNTIGRSPVEGQRGFPRDGVSKGAPARPNN